MKQIAIVVEGQTEEAFVKAILSSRAGEAALTPVVVRTSTTPTRTHKGGGGSWAPYESLLKKLCGQSHWDKIGLLIDFYGFPKDGPNAGEGHRSVQAGVSESFADHRVQPLVMLHEFETLVLAAIDAGAGSHVLPQEACDSLRRVVARAGGCELVNDGPTTAPSKRLKSAFPSYVKTATGIDVIRAAPWGDILARCPTLAGWWSELIR